MKRSHAAAVGQETVRIVQQGWYLTAHGVRVDIAANVARAVAGTCSYPPDHSVPELASGPRSTQIEVRNESTLEAAQRFVQQGQRVVALNFASAKHAGGGFLNGAKAQEESLARSSALYACLVGNAMYDFHQRYRDPLYSHYAIYSPDVPVIRTDDGDLLEQPYLCSFITSPAVNAKVVYEQRAHSADVIREQMWQRILKVLGIAVRHQHEHLVLGAWGCGVFGNNGDEIAELFRRALVECFAGAFATVTFAVLDWSADRAFIGPFERTFHG